MEYFAKDLEAKFINDSLEQTKYIHGQKWSRSSVGKPTIIGIRAFSVTGEENAVLGTLT